MMSEVNKNKDDSKNSLATVITTINIMKKNSNNIYFKKMQTICINMSQHKICDVKVLNHYKNVLLMMVSLKYTANQNTSVC